MQPCARKLCIAFFGVHNPFSKRYHSHPSTPFYATTSFSPLSSFLSFFLSFFLSSSLKEKASYSFFPYLHTDTVCVWRHGHNGNCRPRQSTIHKGPQRSDENPFPGKLVWIAAVPMIRKRGILSFILSYVTIYRD